MIELRTHPLRLGALLLVGAGVAAAVVTRPLFAQPTCNGDPYSTHIEIVDQQRGHLPVYTAPDGTLYVEGTPGNRYQVLVCNPSGQRVLAVVSVDGVNVVSGETAGVQQGGYVLDPGGRMGIAGWRKSKHEVAAFLFTSLSDSYAARTGRPDNVGVIGAAFFTEKMPPPPPPIRYQPQSRNKLDSAAPAAEAPASAADRAESVGAAAPGAVRAPAPAQKLGTGHGERIDSEVRMTTFDRESAPFKVASIRYESRQRLVELGLLPRPMPPTPQPNPFPNGFVPDPPPRRY